MRVAVIGSGGVGGYIGGRLAQAGHEVAFLARGAHLEALRANGLRVKSTDGDFDIPTVTATDQPEQLGQADLFLFTVKTYDTESVAASLTPLLRPGATVLTLQNGIDNHEIIDGVLGSGVALAGTIRIETSIESPGVIAHTSKGAITRFGEIGQDGATGSRSERVETLRAAFAEAGINVAVPDDMRSELWDKFLFIVPFSGLTTLTRAPIGDILASPELTATLLQLLVEAGAVAKAEGADFGADVAEKRLGWMRRLHPAFKSSMQRDLERGKPLEIDALAGALARLGAKHGIPTPVTSAVNAVLALEDQRARAAATA
jgi:2-dehydropantoate 2-reductase